MLPPISSFVITIAIIIAEFSLYLGIGKKFRKRACDFCSILFIPKERFSRHIDPVFFLALDEHIHPVPNVIANGKSVGTFLKEIKTIIKILYFRPCPETHIGYRPVWPLVLNPTPAKSTEYFAVIIWQRDGGMFLNSFQFIFNFLIPVGPPVGIISIPHPAVFITEIVKKNINLLIKSMRFTPYFLYNLPALLCSPAWQCPGQRRV